MLKVGDKAPLEIKLPSTEGNEVSLSDYLGKYVVIYFYPKDDTPTCTKEACSIRDANAEIQKAGAILLGVSKDDLKSHQRFIKKYNLNYPLLADTEGKLIEAFGVWGEKTLFGKTFMGIKRTTFVIDPQGIIVKVWDDVHSEKHGSEILEFLKGL
jgi:peroxiredoxin Q/BCP